MIDSSWLTTFAAFAEDANLSRTARRLHLSQPAVHAQLRKLSEELGVTLYLRAGRGLVLTKEGTEVAAFARESEQRSRELTSRVRGQTEDESLVLAAGTGALLYVIGEGLRVFRRQRKLHLDLLTLDATGAVQAVTSGQAHLGVAAMEVPPPRLETQLLHTFPQTLVMPKAHRLAARRRVTLGDLDGEPLVVPKDGRPHRAMLDAALYTRKARMVVGALASGWELTLRLVELGFGLAVVNGCCRIPRGLVARELHELPGIRYYAFHRASPPPNVAVLLEALAAHVG